MKRTFTIIYLSILSAALGSASAQSTATGAPQFLDQTEGDFIIGPVGLLS